MRVEIDSMGSLEDPNLYDSPPSKGVKSRNRLSKVHPTSDSKTLEDFMSKGNGLDHDDEDWDDIDHPENKKVGGSINVMLGGEVPPTGLPASKRKARMLAEEEKESKENKEYEEWFHNHPKHLKQSIADLPEDAQDALTK